MYSNGRFMPAAILILVLVLAATTRAADPPERAESLRFDADRSEWVELAPPVPGTADGDLRRARALLGRQQYSTAQKAVDQWIKTYGPEDELYPQAALLRCRILIARREYDAAHKKLQEFVAEYGGTEYAEEALTLDFMVAERFLGGAKRKLLGMPILAGDDLGTSILDDIAANHAGTSIAELAVMTKANYYFYRAKDFPFAEQEYAGLVENFPRSRYVRPAMLHTARAALASFPGIEYDDAPLVEAEERFAQYLALYPGSAEQEGIGVLLDDIADRRAAKEFERGRYYERTKHPRAAAFYYRSVGRNWPGTIAAVRAAQRLEKLGTAAEAAPATEQQASPPRSPENVHEAPTQPLQKELE